MSTRIKHPEKVRWNLKKAMLEKRMLAIDLAKKIGASAAYLSHVIMGRYPGYPYREKIAKILGYPEEWLFRQGEECNRGGMMSKISDFEIIKVLKPEFWDRQIQKVREIGRRLKRDQRSVKTSRIEGKRNS